MRLFFDALRKMATSPTVQKTLREIGRLVLEALVEVVSRFINARPATTGAGF